MGQSRNVLVYRLLCENSIDERITDLLEHKQEIFNAFADKSVSAQKSLEIDDKSFGDIITNEIARINAKRGITPASATAANYAYYSSLLQLTYSQLVEKLLSKHGKAQYDYFVNENCLTRNPKISRTREGLFCHHIDEDKAIMLSNDRYAKHNPFAYQKSDRLVYCDFLEHLLLHLKIMEEPRNANNAELPGIGGAVNFLTRQINDFFSGHIPTQEYLAIATSIIEQDYDSYILILNRLWSAIASKPEYSFYIKKEDLARDWNGNIVEKIYHAIG